MKKLTVWPRRRLNTTKVLAAILQPPPMDIISVRIFLKAYQRRLKIAKMNDIREKRTTAGKSPHPRHTLPADPSSCLLKDFSRKRAVLIRQLRTGECHTMGTFPNRLIPQENRRPCRWCRIAGEEETVSHVLFECTNNDLTESRPPPEPPTRGQGPPVPFFHQLQRNPASVLDFYDVCMAVAH